MTTDALIRALLATGTLNEDTSADLSRMLEEYSAGTLHPDDAAYVVALHERLTGTPAPLDADDAPAIVELERIDGLDVHAWRERALAAEAELAALKDQFASPVA